ncbi:hypothetical protein J1N35_000737 [Gossypium stocksii]|uniref:Uncharacterized protein n=1 Tax=Gossypium stocksii TaxID=47602 RepID=A0A9D3WIN7_9ROSI|nr:hypothetical protein J1N35_000737 [Gossypium stocksii]
MSLAHWAKQCITNGTLYQVIDHYLIRKIAPECFKVFVKIAESCIVDLGTDRPSMNDVMKRLGFVIELQKTADVEMSKMYLTSECSYLDIVFSIAWDMDFDDESEVDLKLDSNLDKKSYQPPTPNKLFEVLGRSDSPDNTPSSCISNAANTGMSSMCSTEVGNASPLNAMKKEPLSFKEMFNEQEESPQRLESGTPKLRSKKLHLVKIQRMKEACLLGRSQNRLP